MDQNESKYMDASITMRSAIADYVMAAKNVDKDEHEIASDIADALSGTGINADVLVF